MPIQPEISRFHAVGFERGPAGSGMIVDLDRYKDQHGLFGLSRNQVLEIFINEHNDWVNEELKKRQLIRNSKSEAGVSGLYSLP